MTDTISVLKHSTNIAAKTWLADGTVKGYDDPKYFKLRQVQVHSLGGLSKLLTSLENDPYSCIIRGKYVGDEVARQRDQMFKQGSVRRAHVEFEDQALHTVLIDVDKFYPMVSDPKEDPEEAIAEYVSTLPEVFHNAGYHWQLSSSMGHPTTNPGVLKVHLWFWLEKPYTSAQLNTWAKVSKAPVDIALFERIQVHYTAAPVMDPGVVDPLEGKRSGFVQGGNVALELTDQMLAGVAPGSRRDKMDEIMGPLGKAIVDLIISPCTDGYNIHCPREHLHSTGLGSVSSTQYRYPMTGGNAEETIICFHDSCRTKGQAIFYEALGISRFGNDFNDETSAEVGEEGTPLVDALRLNKKLIPEAQLLVTDQANAERIYKQFGPKLLVSAGFWYVWSGKRWEKDEGAVYRFTCSLSRIVKDEAQIWRAKQGSKEQVEKFVKVADALERWAVRCEMKATIEAAIALTKKMLAMPDDNLDRSPWLLNCLNGTIDLRSGKLQPHTPSDYITKLVPLEYNPDAVAPAWRAVVRRVFLDNSSTISFMQRWFGYCCTGSTVEQRFVVHFGQGSNGKSTILDTVADVLGDYAGTSAPGLMVSNDKGRHPTEIADIAGKRMVTAHETGEGGVLREDFVKQATGSDKLKARWMRGDFFEFTPTHKLQLLTNHKPTIKGQDHGIWRRVLLVPYAARWGSTVDVAVGDAQFVRDNTIVEKLRKEQAGVLAWLVEGAVDWCRRGLQPPEEIIAASEEYKDEQDRIAQFVHEECELGEGYEAMLAGDSGTLYEVYERWCRESGLRPMSKNKLISEIMRVEPKVQRISRKCEVPGGNRKDRIFLVGIRTIDAIEKF